jgi:hypothetical protein
MAFELINPKGLEKPVGYSHVASVTVGSLLFASPAHAQPSPWSK